MTEHGGHHRMIHRHVGARPIEMRNAAQERKALLIEATTCEGPSGEFFDLHHIAGSYRNRRDATRDERQAHPLSGSRC